MVNLLCAKTPFRAQETFSVIDGTEKVFLRFVYTRSKGGFKMDREDIFRLIEQERDRQDMLHPQTLRKKSDNEDIEIIANLIDQMEILAVLIEEVGEVGKALQGEGDLKEELVHTASVCVRWLERIK
jgi:hypothetical protein